MQIKNTGESQRKPSVTLLAYGQGGVGKTTFSATAPKPIIADCENGSKYFGLRGIKVDVAQIESWTDIQEFYKVAKDSDYETIVVDPIGELMEKLKIHIVNSKEKKWVQYDGSLTMAGWGEMKERMRLFIKAIRDLNKHLIIVAHVEEKEDEGKIVKRPKIMTKMSEELIALVDVVGYMETVRVQGEGGEMTDKRIIRVQPSEKYESKDRTGQLGAIIEPDFMKIVNACQGNEVYSWSSVKAKKAGKETKEVKAEVKEEVKDEKVEETKASAKDKLKASLKK
jgi:phage nucleotide-binding protein